MLHSRQGFLHAPPLEGHAGVVRRFLRLHPPPLALQQGPRQLAGFGAQLPLAVVEGMALQRPQQRCGTPLAAGATPAVEQRQAVGGIKQPEGLDHRPIARLTTHHSMAPQQQGAKAIGPLHMARPGRHLLGAVKSRSLADHRVGIHRLQLQDVRGPQQPQMQASLIQAMLIEAMLIEARLIEARAIQSRPIQSRRIQGTRKQPTRIMPA